VPYWHQWPLPFYSIFPISQTAPFKKKKF